MSPRPRIDRAARRAELTMAASRVFDERGVAGTAVSDIVRAAGVAQGTFYLYFESKEDAVAAVAEQFVAELGRSLEDATRGPGDTAPHRLVSLAAALGAMAADPANATMIEVLHRPGNEALHDRLTEPLAQRLFGVVEQIICQGVEEGSMHVPDVAAATWFVLGGLQSVERARTPIEAMPGAIDAATALALRALGVEGKP